MKQNDFLYRSNLAEKDNSQDKKEMIHICEQLLEFLWKGIVMVHLEDIISGSHVIDIASNGPVSVVAVTWHGNDALEICRRNDTCVFCK